MTTIRSDVLVLGSSLGGWVAATYLARAGLRVVLLEEECQAKRPALLREPFLLSGLDSRGRIMRVLRELALPLIEQREIRRKPLALQIVQPDARIDVPHGPDAFAFELASHALAEREALHRWLAALEEHGARLREELWEERVPARGRALRKRGLEPTLLSPALDLALPLAPPGVAELAELQTRALAALDVPAPAPASALLLYAALEGTFALPHAERSFHALFRRRLESLHGEVRSIGAFGLVLDRGDVGVELPRGRLFGRAMVLAAPREPLRAFLEREGTAPSWLEPVPPPTLAPSRLFRVKRSHLPAAMASHVIRADGADPDQLHWLTRFRDPGNRELEWLRISGPGAAQLPESDPLGSLAPFSRDSIRPVDPGPDPQWDLDSGQLRFPHPEFAPGLRTKPPIVTVGPELAPALGFEGEVLGARKVALGLADQLGGRRPLL